MEAADIFQCIQLSDSEQKRDFFEGIYEDYREEMYRTAYRILKNKQDAEDMVQETFVVLFDNLEVMKYNSPQKNWNFMLTILKNKSYNLCKARKRRADKEVYEEMPEDVFHKESDIRLLEMERTEFLAQVLKRMNKSYRDILLLQYYHDMSIAEIAEALGKTPDNVRHISVRARKKLKKLLKNHGFDHF